MAMAFFLFVTPIIFLFLKQSLFKARSKLPPGPNPFHVLTYFYQLTYKSHRAFQKLAQIYGPLISFQLGEQLIVIASSPETAKELCTTHNRVISGRHLPSVYQNLPGSIGSSIVLAPYCSKSWKLLRAIGQSCIFSSKALETNARVRKVKVMELVNRMRSKEGEVADLEDLIFATVVNIVASVLTSRDLFDIESVASDDYKKMMGLINEVVQNVTTFGLVDFLPILKGIDFWSRRRTMSLQRLIKRTWGGIISERKRMGSSTQDFLGIVLDDGTFSDDQIGNALTELLVAGADSTSIITVWLTVELIRNQQMLSKVRDEIAQAVEGDELNETLLSECQYFQACIKETLRLHLSVPLLVPHRAIETCKVNNYVIPKDSMILVNAWAIARDPNYWEDPTTFKPERFLDPKIQNKAIHYEFLPFGTGLRMCPGSKMAVKSIQILVGSLMHFFDWSLPNGVDPSTIDMDEKSLTTLRKAKPLLLIPKLRNQVI